MAFDCAVARAAIARLERFTTGVAASNKTYGDHERSSAWIFAPRNANALAKYGVDRSDEDNGDDRGGDDIFDRLGYL